MNVKIMRNFLLSIHQLSQAIQTTWTRLNNRLKLQMAIASGYIRPAPLMPLNWTEPSVKVFRSLEPRSGKTVSPEMLARIERCQHLHIAIDELQFTQNQVATEGQGIHTAIVRQGRLSEQQREVIRDGLIWLKSFSPNFSNTL
jgi:hypothetical protein